MSDRAVLLPEIAQIVTKKATDYKVEPNLVAAIVFTESSGNTRAWRLEPAWKYFVTLKGVPCKETEVRSSTPDDQLSNDHEVLDQRSSWGLMQIMGAVARQYGFVGDMQDLLKPEIGLDWGLKHFKSFLRRHDQADAVSAYNAGAGGIGSNHEYVARVYGYLMQFRRSGMIQ